MKSKSIKKHNFDAIEIKNKLNIYLNHWKYFIISGIVFLSVAILYLKSASKVYKTTAKIKILDNSKELNISFDALTMLGKPAINLENEIEVLKSNRLLENIVSDLNLESHYSVKNTISSAETWSNPFVIKTTLDDDHLKTSLNYIIKITSKGYIITNTSDKSTLICTAFSCYSTKYNFPIIIQPKVGFVLKNYIGKEYYVVIDSKLSTIRYLTDNLQIENIGKESEILSISLRDKNKEKSEKIINTIIEQFNNDGIKDRQLVSQRTIDFVNDRFNYLAKELENIEEHKETYKKNNDLSLIEFDVENSIKNKAISKSELYKSETQLELAAFLQDVLKQNNSGLIPADIGIENNEINTAIADYNKLVVEKNRIAASGGKNNPTLRLLANAIADNENYINSTIKNYNAKLRIETAKNKKENSLYNSEFAKLPQKEKKLRAIERQQKIKETLYLLLLQKREEAAITLAITNPSVKVVDYAITNPYPIFPKTSIIYLIAFLLSIVVPFLIINLKSILNTKIKSKAELENFLPNVPIVGEVPFVEDLLFDFKSTKTPVLSDVFNLICANINYILPINGTSKGRAIYVTSSIKSEGKTFCAINIAFAYANLGKKVLLIGADLRNPQIMKALHHKKSATGLSDYLHIKNMKWTETITKYAFKTENLDIIECGTIPPNSASLLVNGKFKTLIEESKNEYDYVIVDTAPTLLVSDTKLISKFADTIIVVVRANFTEKEILFHIKENLYQIKSKSAAFLFNDSVSILNKKYNYGYNYNFDPNKV